MQILFTGTLRSYAFIDDDKDMGFSLSYSPWLRALVNDINLAYLSGYKKIDKNSAIGFSLRYFSLGDITFTNNYGDEIRNFKPNEFAIDANIFKKVRGAIWRRYLRLDISIQI